VLDTTGLLTPTDVTGTGMLGMVLENKGVLLEEMPELGARLELGALLEASVVLEPGTLLEVRAMLEL
jgi:hypothetical protein